MKLIFKYNEDETEAICCGMDEMDFDGAVIIPENYDGKPVTIIGCDSFKGTAITSVSIPKTVREIHHCAFAYCKELKEVTFDKESVLYAIEPLAFADCQKLHIRLPERIRVIERYAFSHAICEIPDRRCLVVRPNFEGGKVNTYHSNLPPLAPIESDDLGNEFRLNEDGSGYIAEKIISQDSILIVPEEFNGLPVVELGDKAFDNECDATRAVIPASVTMAGYFPFYGCDDLLSASYGGNLDSWKKMKIYTWFSVYCKDGNIE